MRFRAPVLAAIFTLTSTAGVASTSGEGFISGDGASPSESNERSATQEDKAAALRGTEQHEDEIPEWLGEEETRNSENGELVLLNNETIKDKQHVSLRRGMKRGEQKKKLRGRGGTLDRENRRDLLLSVKAVTAGFTFVGDGRCSDEGGNGYDHGKISYSSTSFNDCANSCPTPWNLVGVEDEGKSCWCLYEDGTLPASPLLSGKQNTGKGKGPVKGVRSSQFRAPRKCYKYSFWNSQQGRRSTRRKRTNSIPIPTACMGAPPLPPYCPSTVSLNTPTTSLRNTPAAAVPIPLNPPLSSLPRKCWVRVPAYELPRDCPNFEPQRAFYSHQAGPAVTVVTPQTFPYGTPVVTPQTVVPNGYSGHAVNNWYGPPVATPQTVPNGYYGPAAVATPQTVYFAKNVVPFGFRDVGRGKCRDQNGLYYMWGSLSYGPNEILPTFLAAATACTARLDGPYVVGIEDEQPTGQQNYASVKCLYNKQFATNRGFQDEVRFATEQQNFRGQGRGIVQDSDQQYPNSYCYMR